MAGRRGAGVAVTPLGREVRTSRCRHAGVGALGFGAWLVCALAAPAGGQEVRGRLAEEGSGRPVPGAHVVLLDASGGAVESTFSGDDGSFRLEAPRAGSYRVEARRIGFETWRSEPMELERGQAVSREFILRTRPVALPSVEVTGERVCATRPAEGSTIARVWEEARKALEAVRWSGEGRRFRYDIVEERRELDPHSLALRRRERERQEQVLHLPFQSRSARLLHEEGYMVRREGTPVFYAPDAEVLLSDSFWADHCFHVVRETGDDDSVRVGLRFRPVPDRTVPEIAGVLWLDAESWELRELRFDYVQLDLEVTSRHVGGEVRFRALEEGPWIVERWAIRAPVIARTRTGGYREIENLVGLRERVARVESVVPVASSGGVAAGATVNGFVYDSLRGGAAAGARVRTADGSVEAVTDARGRYTLTGVPAGTRTLRATAPALDVLGVEPPERVLVVRPERSYWVDLALPSAESLVRATCGEAGAGGASVVAGRVFRTETGDPVPGADVAARAADGSGKTDLSWWTRADAGGAYRLCGVPRDATLIVTAAGNGGADVVEVPGGSGPGFRRQDLHLAPAADGAPPGDVTGREQGEAIGAGPAEGGSGGLTGTVSHEVGGPVPPGEVRVRVAERAIPTGPGGAFALDSLPAGRHRVTVVPAGGTPTGGWTASVDVGPGRAVHLDIVLPGRSPPATTSRPARMRAETRWAVLQDGGFYRRRAREEGQFLLRDELANLSSRAAADTVARLMAWAGDRTRCPAGPALYVDGRRIETGELAGPGLDDALLALEAYRAGRVPGDLRAEPRCGAVVLWTLPGTEVPVQGRGETADTGAPPVFIDGRRVRLEDEGGDLASPVDVAAVEVDRSRLETPLRFLDRRESQRGAMVIRTGG